MGGPFLPLKLWYHAPLQRRGMGDQIKVTASCAKCGSNDLITDDDTSADSLVICNACGNEIGSFGDYRAALTAFALKRVKKELQGAIGQAFEGSENIKFVASPDEEGDVQDE